ncbi:DUF4442 domain-containing protein [Bdellovibrio sp. NC01]|uniref:DUF4442 domain-containing protein n=1 Tax=Bdellovibrio sp. NC01 TaxID=2220073 RepID=UPI00115AE565|nr:DUF4442 domain-containing protein [Bdellovibrio sp. NC01]QDK38162.1 tetrameric acyl-CoA thioesterase [Bdellovibrio sp. NC01]
MIVRWLRAIAERTPTWVMRLFFNIYPPYFGAGVEVEEISKDRRYLRVALKLRFYNRNYVGTQFGGSIYSMTDPHFMYLLINNLGPGYVVWDKAAKIDFIKPGKTKLLAEFRIDDALLNEVKARTANNEKYIFDLSVTIKDIHGETIAEVIKTLYVRKKKPA